ncbi:MAG: hypothetical protein JRG96_05460 [Deltaproteobacteria bacterium]|nr:hypothetical protein [Deltaproteobacteria bacterium]MBW2421775.1 hypothetical protein [Deltaproteobacteria bacterium]
METGRHRKQRAFRLGLVVAVAISCLLSLGLAEIGARLLLPAPWYLEDGESSWPPFMKRRVGAAVEYLRAGMEAPAPEDAYRILFLGDSFTYGVGVDESQTFVSRIVTRLNEGPPNEGFREHIAFNGGIPGSLTGSWKGLHEAAQELFQPHLVVVVFFLRDGQIGAGSTTAVRKMKERLRELHGSSFLFQHSYLYRQLFVRPLIREVGKEYLSTMADGYFGPPARTQEWKRAQSNVLAMRDRAEEHGAKFVMVIFPVLFDLGPDYPLRNVVDVIADFARSNDIQTLSLLPAYTGHEASELWLSSFDQHPNERGHAIAADAIHPLVARLVAHDPNPLPAAPLAPEAGD